MIKNVQIREKVKVQIRGEFLNAFNRAMFPAPNTNPAVVAFGTIAASTQASFSRRVQLRAPGVLTISGGMALLG